MSATVDRYKHTFGNEGRVTYPRVRVTVQGDGWLEIVVCRNKREYRGEGHAKPERMYIPPSAGATVRDALIAAMPKSRREQAARQKRGWRHDKRHPMDVPGCGLCDVRKYR